MCRNLNIELSSLFTTLHDVRAHPRYPVGNFFRPSFAGRGEASPDIGGPESKGKAMYCERNTGKFFTENGIAPAEKLNTPATYDEAILSMTVILYFT
jgi:hypothetical protein